MNIFEITQELQDVFAELEENGGDLTPELEQQLTVTQNDFKQKVKSYSELIKSTEAEIKLIDDEVDRLKSIKDSKKKAIERLKKIIIWAIGMFGDTNKNGNKYLDYGTGKISIRNTEKVEVNTDTTDKVVKNFFSYLSYISSTGELDNLANTTPGVILNAIADMDDGVSINYDELSEIQTTLSFDVNIKDLLEGKGLDFVKQFMKFVEVYKAKSNINKTALKEVLKEGNVDLHNIAELTPNQTITIK